MNRRKFLNCAAAAVAASALPAADAKKPNIVIIYADDVGYGDLSCYGATNVHTPNLDRLAASGLRHTNAHAPSATCTPSRYALMTGEYAWRKEGTGILPGDASLIIAPGRVTLPSALKAQGYTTAAIGKWHLGLGTGNLDWNSDIKPGPLELGFDYAYLIPATGDRVPCVFVENHRVVNLDPGDPIEVSYRQPFPAEPTGKDHPELLRMHPSHGHADAIVNGVSRIGFMKGGKSARWVDEDIADTLTNRCTGFIERSKGRPFFVYFATHDIHVPRLPNGRFVGKSRMGARGDAILELDASVGKVLDCLDRNNLTNDTLVIFSSDNGPVVDDGYRDEAVQKLGTHKPAGPYRGGKYSNFDGGTRVPMVVRWPGHVQPDSESGALISHVDILASLAGLAGYKLPPRAAPDSLDSLATILGQSKQGRANLVEHAGVLSIVEGDWKLIRPSTLPKVNKNTQTEMGNDPSPQLYNLVEDPGEKTNLATRYPQRVDKLTRLLVSIQSASQTRP